MIKFSLKEGDRLQITGLRALIEIVVQFAFVWLAFAAIQGIHFERFFNRPPRTLPLLIVLMATGLGYLCATFFLNILSAIGNLTYLIR
ncbi:DUF1146 domain-containing protein [Lactobacillus sp. 0.1XD8-4]|uniref:DUF1146 domain-containing protein n=1 Tax=Limosilactobacillus walteri TaxID=2268022 RepID=A0ABR8P8G8_9LACO|nr:DUF1146 family protein [Limosilactobacillus walteri]MBD5807057.1 DUF1146 domain-containing protein [Limosilactobacillus walteri]MRN06577.1 DUF1146 domain-containing protein [Lactobacillus sp. 0.1XD8-4]